MEFSFDNIVAGAKDLFDKASVKAGEAIDYSKGQIDKSQLRNKLKEKYTELGKAYYAEKTEGTNASDAIGKLVDEITDINNKIEELEASRTVLSCPKCGTEYTKGISFCGNCGTKLD